MRRTRSAFPRPSYHLKSLPLKTKTPGSPGGSSHLRPYRAGMEKLESCQDRRAIIGEIKTTGALPTITACQRNVLEERDSWLLHFGFM